MGSQDFFSYKLRPEQFLLIYINLSIQSRENSDHYMIRG
jgi:hypothetical protein